MTQRYTGTKINRMVPFLLRFCKVVKHYGQCVVIKMKKNKRHKTGVRVILCR
jgi:hypothetical protein